MIGLFHDTLKNFYSFNFNMMTHFSYTLSDIENMIPWERQIYLQMLVNHVEKQNQELKKKKNG